MRTAVAVLIAVAVSVAAPAAAGISVWESGLNGISVSDSSPGHPGTPGAAAPSHPTGPVYSYWAIGWDGDRFCRVRRYTSDAALANGYRYAQAYDMASSNAFGSTAECPSTPNGPAPAAPPSPETLARQFWDVRILPTPTLRIVPDYAITGKRVYLQIGGERAKHFDVANPLGPGISIEATGVYVIDWGDGTVETTTSQGGPWPDGDVTHVYTHTNPGQIIRVTQRWSATWAAGEQRGTLDGLQTAATFTFRVTQVQAVRN